MKTILAPIDFSGVSDSVVSTAAALARALEGRVVLMHAVRPPVIVNEYAPEVEKMALLAEQTAAQQLGAMEALLRSQDMQAESVETFGHPVPSILAEAGRLSADYIVMGSHGHTALYNLLVGSTASGVLHHAQCPVVVVPPPGKSERQEMRSVGQKVERKSAMAGR